MENDIMHPIALGARIGRSQAFGFIANKSLAAQAQNLLELKESGAYKILDLDWEQFCPLHVGLTRRQVDAIIENLREFGDIYFKIKEIVCISPETFRQIAPQIQDQTIEIAGEMVPVIPENAIRIRDAVNHLRTALRKANDQARQANDDIDLLTTPELAGLQSRIDSCFYDLRRMAPRLKANRQQATLHGLVQHAMSILQEITRNFLQ